MNIKQLLLTVIFIYSVLFSFSQELFPFKNKNNKYGYRNNKDIIVVMPKYDYAQKFSEDLALVFIGNVNKNKVTLNGKFGYIDKNGNEIISCKYDDAKDFSEGVAAVMLGNKWGYIDKRGQPIIDFKYDYVLNFSSNIALVFKGDIGSVGYEALDSEFGIIAEYELINEEYDLIDGEDSIMEYDEIDNWNYPFYKRGKYGYVNHKGEEIISVKYNQIFSFEGDIAKVFIGKMNEEGSSKPNKGNYGYININGEEITKIKYNYIEGFNLGYARVFIGEVDEYRYPRPNKGNYGYIDKNGNEITKIKYNYIEDFNLGYARVFIGEVDADGLPLYGKYGCIDSSGYEITKCIYDKIYNFSENLAIVKTNKKYGFLNKEGKLIIPAIYDNATDFYDGKAQVKLNGIKFFIDINGKEVLNKNIIELVLPIGHTDLLLGIDISSDGKSIVTTSSDGTAKVWNNRNGELLYSVEGENKNYINSAKFSPNGDVFFTFQNIDTVISIWNTQTGKLLKKINFQEYVFDACWLQSGKEIIVNKGHLISIEKTNITDRESYFKSYSNTFSNNPNKEQLLIVKDNEKFINTFKDEDTHTSTMWSPKLDKVLLINYSQTEFRMLDIKNQTTLFKLNSEIFGNVKFSTTGDLFSVTEGNVTIIIDSYTGKTVHVFKGKYCPWYSGAGEYNFSSWSPDGSKILTTTNRKFAKIWDVKTGNLLSVLKSDTAIIIKNAIWSPNGENIITMPHETYASVWDAHTGDLLHELKGHSNPLVLVELSENNNFFLTGSKNYKSKIWNIDDLSSYKQLEGEEFIYSNMIDTNLTIHKMECNYFSYWLSNEILETRVEDERIIWNIKTGSSIIFNDDYSNVPIELSPDNKKAALCFSDSICIYDLYKLENMLTIKSNIEVIFLEWLSNDNIIVKTNNNRLNMWDIESNNLSYSLVDKRGEYSFGNILSPDKDKIFTIKESIIYIHNSETGTLITQLDIDSLDYDDKVKWINNTKLLIIGANLYLWDIERGEKLLEIKDKKLNIILSPDSTKILLSNVYNNIFIIVDINCGRIITSGNYIEHKKHISNWRLNNWLDDETIYYVDYDNVLHFINAKNGKIKNSDSLSELNISDIDHDMIFSLYNGQVKINDINTGAEIVRFIPIDISGSFIKTPDNYYLSTKNAIKYLSFKIGGELYSFEQFDLKYNRPDIVLSRLGYADSTLINAYHKAYLKRLKKMGFKEGDLNRDFHIPESKIKNFEDLPVITDTSDIGLNLHFEDSEYKLDRINVWINDVAIYGTRGINLREENTSNIDKDIRLKLSEGKNKIQVSCLNQKGAESYKETVDITYTVENKTKTKQNIYLIVISVSEYQQSEMNLRYAVKDGRDMANLFSTFDKKQWNKVFIDTLFNQNATIENVSALKQKLMQSNVNDQVILYVSGHGLLDNNLDFYFASHDMDFAKPELRGISYESLENLLDSIPARKKLFMMDACHSGEVDKDELEETNLLAQKDKDKKNGLKTFSYRGANVLVAENNKTTKLGLQNSFELMQELFTNLNRGSGAVVISAAGGDSYALESDKWNNGVFTYAVINGLQNMAADANEDKEVSVSELRSYVITQVQELTNGRQKPTSRQENVEFDFRIW